MLIRNQITPRHHRLIAIMVLAGFLLLTLACGSFAPRPGALPTSAPTATALTATPLPTAFTPTPRVSSQAADVTPTAGTSLDPGVLVPATPESTPTPTPAGNLAVGRAARIVARSGINIRQEPSRTAGRAGFFASGALVEVADGPVYADDLTWWQVDDQHGKKGWVAGGDGTDLWLSGDIGKPRPVNRPVRLGDTVTVSVSPGKVLTVRFEPGKKGFVARRLQAATRLSIVDGPVTLNGLRWWKVLREDGLSGWAAEGDTERRWLSPME
ncbi:MAG: SH3 domain-containing protein [Chloroflexi bacterium]|nr:SH3 domain-containing protein [Chloroflexota bacterium]